MKPTVFLDRDGVLAEEKGYVCSVHDLHIFPFARDCIKEIHDKGYLAIVITNQGGIAKNLFTEETLLEMNKYLTIETNVDAIYYCPHHPEGVNPLYTKNCHCRKPEIGMIEKACQDFDINLENSYMVGDRACDIQLGQNVGIKTVLLESGYGTLRIEAEVRQDYLFNDLKEFVNWL